MTIKLKTKFFKDLNKRKKIINFYFFFLFESEKEEIHLKFFKKKQKNKNKFKFIKHCFCIKKI
jgi:hypothetical protein